MQYVIAYITTRDHTEAKKIGEAVVKERLAACANIIPVIESIYWWKGKLERNNESMLLLKTKKSLASKLIKRIKEIHSYEVPCVDIIPMTEGNKDYFKWIEEVTR
ncbi:MAG: divalent-cation tolerance protein CutA [Candidatus Aenigmarchaeota archaeon]|nr:divalent-cation tolerance protein CutA [Candidatus Aenigmarchaeota archaeon]